MKARSLMRWLGVALSMFASSVLAETLNWQSLPAKVTDIGVGANGAVWMTSTVPYRGGYSVNRWLGQVWEFKPAGAVRIDVDPQGNPWIITDANEIYRYNGSTFVKVPGQATDVGIGANGTVWTIGTDAAPGGYGVYRWNGTGWDKMPGSGVRIDVDPQGNAWIVTKAHEIWRYNGSTFVKMPGAAQDIGIGGEGSVWIAGTGSNVTTDGMPYLWSGSAWIKTDGVTFANISVGPKGELWGATNSGSAKIGRAHV